jgi:hypothetical protein
MIPAEKGVYPVVTHSFADAEKGAVGMILGRNAEAIRDDVTLHA